MLEKIMTILAVLVVVMVGLIVYIDCTDREQTEAELVDAKATIVALEEEIEDIEREPLRVIDIVMTMDGGVEHGEYIVKHKDSLEIVSRTRPEDEWLYEEVRTLAPCDDYCYICIIID